MRCWGVDKGASEKDIKKAYRKLAREYHPDVNQAPGAEAKFKEIAEAYEVVGDPEKRSKYDQLGANWKAGQDFSPPPGWGQQRGGPRYEYHSSDHFGADDLGGFSDFFSELFGGMRGGGMGGGPGRRPGAAQWRARGQDHEASIDISLLEALQGIRKAISLQTTDVTPDGQVTRGTKNLNVNIPAGTGG